jgi:UDP-N-acetylmuramate dehydrogenase
MIPDQARRALVEKLGDRLAFDVPLSAHTSLRIGGPADAMATPADRPELASVLATCHAHDVPVRVLGSGFNVLVSDAGLRGMVLRLKKIRGIEQIADDRLRIEAGASHATITRYCVEHGLTGLEFGVGIPGTLGGWLAMNAGIGSREMRDVVERVEFLDQRGRDCPPLLRSDLDFRYRELAGLPRGCVLVAADLGVRASTPADVQTEIEGLLARRQATQPTNVPSCGSVFRNPPGDHAGRLIESAGLKGAREGAAEVSKLHANFIVNSGGATAWDVLRLIERIRETVASETGTRLETEVQLIGDLIGGVR